VASAGSPSSASASTSPLPGARTEYSSLLGTNSAARRNLACALRKGRRAHGVDVFDSLESYQQFVQSTLVPAMGKVAAARGLDMSNMGEPAVTITEVHRLVH
jgi:hypothetical protein